jgi:hypothetical protein
MKSFFHVACAAACLALAQPAVAQGCVENFSVEGVPMLTAMNYRSAQYFAGLDAGRALSNLRRAMLAEGFNVEMDSAGGALTAVQETSGSGRPQTLRVTARKSGPGTRVDAVFMIQQGQVTSGDMVRTAMCRIIASARS